MSIFLERNGRNSSKETSTIGSEINRIRYRKVVGLRDISEKNYEDIYDFRINFLLDSKLYPADLGVSWKGHSEKSSANHTG